MGPVPPSGQLKNREVAKGTGTFCVQSNANGLPEEKEQGIACILFARKSIDIGCGKPMSMRLVKVSMKTSGNYPSCTSLCRLKGANFLESLMGYKWIETLPQLWSSPPKIRMWVYLGQVLRMSPDPPPQKQGKYS